MAASQRANASHGYVDKQDVSLHDHIDKVICDLESAINNRISYLEKALDARFTSQEKAIAVASVNSEKKFDSTNEWRNTVTDITHLKTNVSDFNTFKETYAKDLKDIKDLIKSLELTRENLAGKASQLQFYIVLGISIVGLILNALRP